MEQDENVAGGEGRVPPEAIDQPAVERDGRHDLAQAARAGNDIDREAGGEPRRRTDAQTAGADDVERTAVPTTIRCSAPAVALGSSARCSGRERATCSRLRLRAIRLLRVERERCAQPGLLPEGDLARLAGAGDGAEPPVRRRQRDEREQHEVRHELELEAAQPSPPPVSSDPSLLPIAPLGKLSAGEGDNMSVKERVIAGLLLAVAVAGGALIPHLLASPAAPVGIALGPGPGAPSVVQAPAIARARPAAPQRTTPPLFQPAAVELTPTAPFTVPPTPAARVTPASDARAADHDDASEHGSSASASATSRAADPGRPAAGASGRAATATGPDRRKRHPDLAAVRPRDRGRLRLPRPTVPGSARIRAWQRV